MSSTTSPRTVVWGFALRSLLVVVVIGIAAHVLVLRPSAEQERREATTFHAGFVGEVVVAPLLDERPTDDELRRRLADLVAGDDLVVGLTLRRGTGDVVVGGMVDDVVDVVDLDGSTSLVVRSDRSVLQAATDADVRRSDVVLLVTLLAIWAVLLPLAHRLGSALDRRGRRLEVLLGREQETTARLEELGRLREEFVTAAAHELRTPTTVVVGALRTLEERRGALDAGAQERLLASAGEAGERLVELVEGLALVHGSGSVPAVLARVDLRAAVRAAVDRLGRGGVTVDVPPLVVRADHDHLARTLDALLSNAVRHGEPPVVVDATVDRDVAHLTVEDAGPGFPDGTWEQMLLPFRQGPLRDAHQPGVGIGLTTAARRVAALGGRMWAGPGADGRGTCVHVELSLATDPGVPGPGVAAEALG